MDKEIICKCGKTFTRKSKSRRKYCFECRPEEYIHEYTTTKTKELVCIDCRKPFTRNIKSKFKRCKECQEKFVIEKTLEKAVEKKNKRPKIQKVCISCNEQFEIIQSWNSRSRKKCDKCKEEEKKIKIVQSRKIICPKCSNEFESDRVYLRCNKCNAFLLECEECKKIFERESKYSKNKICDSCLFPQTDLTKEKLHEEYITNERSVDEISKIYKTDAKYISRLLRKHEITKFDEINGIEKVDYVICQICRRKGKNLTKHIKKSHKLSAYQYKELYNNYPTRCEKITKRNGRIIHRHAENGRYDECHNKNIKHYNGINQLEEEINSLHENLIFVGGSEKGCQRLFVKLKARYKNPDFVKIDDNEYLKNVDKSRPWYEVQNQVTKDFRKRKFEVKKVVELNGYNWHFENFKGRTYRQYEHDLINEYKEIGIDCLVIWDFEMKSNFDEIKIKVNTFLKGE